MSNVDCLQHHHTGLQPVCLMYGGGCSEPCPYNQYKEYKEKENVWYGRTTKKDVGSDSTEK